MTASAAEMRRVRMAWPRRLAARSPGLAGVIVAAHVATAATVALVTMLLEPLADGSRLQHGMAVVGMALSTAAFGGVWIARQVTAPLAEFCQTVAAVARRDAAASDVERLAALATRGDELGDLSAAISRILADASEALAASDAFAAEIAHEIRNPLASLRSAAEAMQFAEPDQKQRLVGIIDKDVRRLDRLVGEISSASRLDAELVREQASEFDLFTTVRELASHLSRGARGREVELIADLPAESMPFVGLEARLAQVVVNLVENAVSLSEAGDAIRIWARRRDDRVLIVVEDTGPGIPDGASERIFRRFYSYRPEEQFGANCGLGLAISRQIVEAHGGAIWAENIRPTESDLLSEPLGARFVVVLPL